jgi:hypothetical protein
VRAPATTARSLGLFLAFCALVVCARVIASGSYELRTARSLEAEQRWHAAAAGYGSTIRMYLPGSPLGAAASDRLLLLADRARAHGEPDEERFCLEELRSGWLSVRSLWQPGQRFVTEAEARLAAGILADPRGNWPPRTLDADARAAEVARVLAVRGDPAAGWVVLMGLGYLLWIGGAGLALWRGLPAQTDAPVRWKILGRWAAASAAGYLLWLLAVAKA